MSKKPINIVKLARIHDRATDTYLVRLQFPTSENEVSTIDLPPSVVAEPLALERRLRDAGAVLPDDDVRNFLRRVGKSPHLQELIYESQTGWNETRNSFAMVDRAIGGDTNNVLGVRTSGVKGEVAGRIVRAGTVKGWSETIGGDLTSASSLIICSVSAAFAAPLLSVAKIPSFTICMSGRSRSGKTIATIAAGSVIGLGNEDALLDWKTTGIRLEQRLGEFRDQVMLIDDLMSMRDSGARERYELIRKLSYHIATGSATARDGAYTNANGGRQITWRTIALTSNEVTIAEEARNAKMERKGGESVRLIDLPAYESNQAHIFDLRDDTPSLEWTTNRFKEIAIACDRNKGSAFISYLKFVLGSGNKIDEYVEKRMGRFLKHVSDPFDGDLAKDIARKYALIYAGGMLARRAGIITWRWELIREAISRCYYRSRTLLQDDGEIVRSGLHQLEQKLAELPREKTLDSSMACERADGFRRRSKGGDIRFVIKRQCFEAIFSSRQQMQMVERWLLSTRRVVRAVRKSEHDDRAKAQIFWPDGHRRRCLEIRWPQGNPTTGA